MSSTPLWIISGIFHSINCPKPSSQGTYLASYLDHTSLKTSLSINANQKLKQVCSCVISEKRTHPNAYFFQFTSVTSLSQTVKVVLAVLRLYLFRYPLFSFQICYPSFSLFSPCDPLLGSLEDISPAQIYCADLISAIFFLLSFVAIYSLNETYISSFQSFQILLFSDFLFLCCTFPVFYILSFTSVFLLLSLSVFLVCLSYFFFHLLFSLGFAHVLHIFYFQSYFLGYLFYF